MQSNLKDKPSRYLTSFLVLTFLFTWSLMGVGIGINYGYIGINFPFIPLLLVGSWMPNLVVIGILAIKKESSAIGHLLRGWLKWKIRVIWYVVAVFPLLFVVPATVLTRLIHGPTQEAISPIQIEMWFSLILFALITGATGEELGWRGFLLPRLQAKMSTLRASVYIGLVWSLWHYPLWYTGLGHEEIPMLAFTIIGIGSSILMSWGCNNTRGSLVFATLFHFCQNLSLSLLAPLGQVDDSVAIWYLSLAYAVAALFVVLRYGYRTLTKSKTISISKTERNWLP